MLYCVGVCVGVRERERDSFFFTFYLFIFGWAGSSLPRDLFSGWGSLRCSGWGSFAVLRLGLVAVLGLLITVASLAVERARQPRCVNVRGLDACSL